METLIVGKKFEKYDYRETCFGIVVNNNKLLVTKKHNEFALVGGGIEKEETHEECLHREFKEESGYTITNIQELICVDCFWLAANKYPMESKANIYIVEVDLNNINNPTEDGCQPCWIDLNSAIDNLPLPYHKKAIEIYLKTKTTN